MKKMLVFLFAAALISFSAIDLSLTVRDCLAGSKKIDVLFTLDRSQSMSMYLDRFLGGSEAFFSRMNALGVDYHIALTVEDDGCIVGADCYIDSSFSLSNAVAAFQTMAAFSGLSANCERGFTLAEAALNPLQAGPGGCNEGFLRSDAALALVHISDEPEQSEEVSEQPYTYYVDLFQSLKPYADDVVINAIAGDYPTGCGAAMPGTGYYEATRATGGVFLSICAPDWTSHYEMLADAIVEQVLPIPGDINRDDQVDTADAVLALQAMVALGSSPAPDLRAEIDGDLRAGMAEALYALRRAAAPGGLPVMQIHPESLFLSLNRTEDTAMISNNGGGSLSWAADAPVLPSWIGGINPPSGEVAGGQSMTVTISVSRSGLDPSQTHHASIPIRSNAGDGSIEITLGFENGWSRSIGFGDGDADYHANAIQQTEDGGYILIYESLFGSEGGYDYGIAKIGADGSLMWDKGWGGSSGDAPKAVIQTKDGGYLVAGNSYSFRTGDRYCDIVLVKLDANGNLLWQKHYGGSGTDTVSSLAPVADPAGRTDGYILAASTNTSGDGGYDAWVLRLQSDGGILWQRTYGASENEFGRAITSTADGGFVLAADTLSFGAGSRDVWLLKLEKDGNVTWEKAYGGSGSETPYSVVRATGGGVVVGASTSSFVTGAGDDENFWAFHIDENGDLVWQFSYGGPGSDVLRDLRRTPDGGYILAGWSDSFGMAFLNTVYNDAWLVKIDASGALQWQKNYNKPQFYEEEIVNLSDWAYAVVPARDGGYAVSGDTDWEDAGRNSDVWIFKVNGSGELGCGIETDTTGTADGGHPVSITESNTYLAGETGALPGNTSGSLYAIHPEVFVHCGPETSPQLTEIEIIPTTPYGGYVTGAPFNWPDGGFTNQFQIICTYSNGDTVGTDPSSATWQSDSEAAGISAGGLLVSGNVQADTAATITATIGDVSATSSPNNEPCSKPRGSLCRIIMTGGGIGAPATLHTKSL